MNMKRIIAYHSNLYFDEFKNHVKEIKDRGFNVILFCITETDLLYNLETFQEFREYSESEGLECWATFWGLTAGEAVCKDGDVDKWMYSVKNIGFNDVMIDEPKRTEDIYFFTGFSYLVNLHLCLTDDTFNKLSDGEIEEMPVNSIGVSCYHWVKDWPKITRRTHAIAERLHTLRPHDNFVFVQGFDIPEGMEDLPVIVKDIASAYGIDNFGFWSFRCTAATSSKRPVNYKKIWDAIDFKLTALNS